MSIELVDKIDQQGKGGKRYQRVGGLNDLLFTDEGSTGASSKRGGGDEEASVSSFRSTATTEDYVGLELESVMQRKIQRRKSSKFLLIALAVSMIFGSVVYFRKTKQRASAAGHPNDDDDDGHGPSGSESRPSVHTQPNDDDDDDDTTTNSVPETRWPTQAPAPEFDICKPHFHFKHENDIYHILDITIVPEDEMTDDSNEWEYTFTSMDISEQASIIAVGLGDYSASTSDWAVGMVRVFAFDCHHHKYLQLGQDLLGTKNEDQFGASIVSSKDGKVMAISATQAFAGDDDDDSNNNGYVVVYYLDSNVWKPLGDPIQDLKDSEKYYNLGSTIAISDDGETLAVVGTISTQKFVTRVFYYEYNEKKWIRKGHDLTVEVSDDAAGINFKPAVSLSADGDTLGVLDPEFGLVMYGFSFENDKWTKDETTKLADFGEDEYYTTSLDLDDSSNLVAFSAYGFNLAQVATVYDFTNGTEKELYTTTYKDYEVSLQVKVSDDGTVAAILASQIDMDDTTLWDYDDVGALTVVSVNDNGSWEVLGAGGDCENYGVPGNFISLSGAGDIAAVGTDKVISLYGIRLNHEKVDHGDESSSPPPTPIPEASESEGTFSIFDVCPPYPDGKVSSAVGDILDLPKQADQHTLSLALSGNSSIVAVGIDSWDSEDRGMARVFGWNCETNAFEPLGQDIYGQEGEDGFGQSVDLSEDGATLVVGANQPVPGKSGYVDVYHLDFSKGWVLEKRIETVKEGVEDIGREVRISSDASTVAFLGSFIDETADNEFGWRSSFIRVMEKVDNEEWKEKGEDLMESIAYDSYGVNVKMSFAADGSTLGVVGSYDTFMAKIYDFDTSKSNWTETVVPPVKSNDDDDSSEDEFDYDMDQYFDGMDIAMSDNGNTFAVAGNKWGQSPMGRVLQRQEDGTFSMSHDAITYDAEYQINSIGMSATANVVAAGVNWGDDSSDHGAFYVSIADDSDNGWSKLGTVDGKEVKDLLGSRVAVSSDGHFVAGSSRKGYVSFFRTSVKA